MQRDPQPRSIVDGLLGLTAALEPFTLLAALAGPNGHPDDGRVALRSLRPDPRCAAASLFGVLAPPGTLAVAVGVLGTARPLGTAVTDPVTAGPIGTQLRIDVVVHRDGTVRHRTRGTDGSNESVVDDEVPCSGLLVDALHLALGMPSPGACPPVTGLALGLWSSRLLHVPDGTIRTWRDAVALLPAPTTGPPTPAAVAGACRRFDRERGWAGLRADIAAGRTEVPDLSPAEAEWLDTTAFARWCVQTLPTAGWTERELRANSPGIADRYAEVARDTS